jgi:hypothetical protein
VYPVGWQLEVLGNGDVDAVGVDMGGDGGLLIRPGIVICFDPILRDKMNFAD